MQLTAPALLGAAVALYAFDPSAAPQTDQFKNFSTDIEISAEGTLQVRETLQVYFSRRRGGIRHRIPYTFDDLAVTLDGHTERFLLADPERPGWVRIGTKPRRVPPGAHVYALSYRTGPEVTFHGPLAHFSWSTGEHPIPFQSVVVRFHLPVCALLRNVRFDTNMERVAAHNATANIITIRTTKPISPKAGLHASVDFENHKHCAQG